MKDDRKIVPLHAEDVQQTEAFEITVGMDPDDPAEQEKDLKDMSLRELFSVLPEGLFRKVLMQFLTGVGILLLSLIVLITSRSPQVILGLFLAIWLVWGGISILLDFQAGRIIERVVVCVSCNRVMARDKTKVVFRTPNEEFPTYYEYYIPGRKTKSFTPGMTYLTYVREVTPQLLLGYHAL